VGGWSVSPTAPPSRRSGALTLRRLRLEDARLPPGEPAPPSPLHALAHRPHLFTMLTRAVVAMCMQVGGAAAGVRRLWHHWCVLRLLMVALVASAAACRRRRAAGMASLWRPRVVACMRLRPLLAFWWVPGRDSGLWCCVRAEMRALVCCGSPCVAAGSRDHAAIALTMLVPLKSQV